MYWSQNESTDQMKSHNQVYLWTYNLEELKPALYYNINQIPFTQFG